MRPLTDLGTLGELEPPLQPISIVICDGAGVDAA